MDRSQLLRYGGMAGILLFACVAAGGQEAVRKKRVAILNFDNPNFGAETPSGLYGPSGENVGKGVSLALIQKLLETGKFTIVDQIAVEKLIKDQKDDEGERLEAYGRAAKIGRLLGLDAMIVGAVTRYGPEGKQEGDRKENAAHSGMHTRKAKASVEIAAQVFNVSTGEVMASFTGGGESANFGSITTVAMRDKAKTSVEMLGSEFVERLLGEATGKAVEQVAGQLNLFAEKIPQLRIAAEGLVAEVAGSTLTLNIGSKAGVKVGDRVEILRDPRRTTDSGTASTVQPVAERIGQATVTEVGDDYAMATLQGLGQPAIGDRVIRASGE